MEVVDMTDSKSVAEKACRFESDQGYLIKLSGGVVVTHVTLTHTSQVRPLPGHPCSCDGNGRRSGLKIRCLKRRAGSSPVGSTI